MWLTAAGGRNALHPSALPHAPGCSTTAAAGGESLLGIARWVPRPRLGRHRGICVADGAIDRLHGLAVGADVQPADGIADIGGRWIAALRGRSIRRHRLEHHPGLNHRQNAPRLVRSAGSQPLSRGQQLRRSGRLRLSGRGQTWRRRRGRRRPTGACSTRCGAGCAGGGVGLGAAGRVAAAAICCSCAFCRAAAASSNLRCWRDASKPSRNLTVSARAESRSCERCATCCCRSAI